jgi:hypothetical protein
MGLFSRFQPTFREAIEQRREQNFFAADRTAGKAAPQCPQFSALTGSAFLTIASGGAGAGELSASSNFSDVRSCGAGAAIFPASQSRMPVGSCRGGRTDRGSWR